MNPTVARYFALLCALTLVGSGCAWLGRASQTTGADPTGATDRGATSANARYIAYAAHTDTSAPGVLDGVYRWDTVTNTRKLVSVGSNGAQADDASHEPAISADGRYVAFSSDATNLVANDTNATTDVFVRDLAADTTQRVSITSTGGEVTDPSYTPSISDDGRSVAFLSDSDDLSSLDNNGSADAYVFDRSLQTVKLSSIVGGVQPDFGISEAVLSGDGLHLAFTTDTDLLAADQNFSDDVYLKNLSTGTVIWVSRPKLADPQIGGGTQPSLSYNGQYVAFVGASDIDNASDPYPEPDVFVRDTVNKTVQRASTTSTGGYVNGASFTPVITSDGARVVFSSTGNVSGNDTNGAKVDAFVKDLATGNVTLVSTEMFLSQRNVDTYFPTISGDGRYAAFVSIAQLAPDDTNAASDVYVRAIDVPKVLSIAPTSASRGASVNVTITGKAFLAGATVVPLGGIYFPTAVAVNSSTSMTVTLAIDSGAPTGPQTIYVQNPGTGPGSGTGGVGRCENCLTIK